MRAKRVFALLMVVAILSCTFAMLTACNNENEDATPSGAIYEENYTPTKNKAMILIPGLMASALSEESTDEPMWCPTGFLRLAEIYTSRLSALNEQYPESQRGEKEYTDKKKNLLQNILIEYLACDENGVPNTLARVCNRQSSNLLDSFRGMGYLWEILYAYYHEQYDVLVWQYDWRQSNVESAKHLEEFINKCGYEKVQFYTHSMGGIVVSNWLQKAENREKVELFVPCGAPFLGSMDAITNLFSEDAFASLKPILNGMGLSFNLAEVARTIPSVVELLPCKQYFDLYEGGTSPITIDGVELTYDEFLEALYNQSWAKNSKGEVKSFIANLKQYHEAFFVNATYDSELGHYVEDPSSAEKVHVSQLVPTEYVLGVGVSTCKVTNLVTGENGNWKLSSLADDLTEFSAVGTIFDKYINGKVNGQTSGTGQKIVGYKDGTFYGAGDGPVPARSATAGLELNVSNAHLVFGIKHGPLINDSCDAMNGFAPAYLTGLAYVDEIVPKYVKQTDSEMVLKSGSGSGRPVSVAEVGESEKITAIVMGAVMSVVLVAVVVSVVVTMSKKSGKGKKSLPSDDESQNE